MIMIICDSRLPYPDYRAKTLSNKLVTISFIIRFDYIWTHVYNAMRALFCFSKEMIQKENRKEINFPIEISGEVEFTKQNILFPYRKERLSLFRFANSE